MIFVYIENHYFLTKVIQYLTDAGIKYTTDLNIPFSYILVVSLNSKILKFIDEYPDKKVIFMTHFEENKILSYFSSNSKRSRLYQKLYHSFCNRCYKLIVSLPYFKTIFKYDCKKIDVIPIELPDATIKRNTKYIYDKYNFNKKRKKIVVIDLFYKNISYVHDISINYPKFDFIYIGYKPIYLFTNKEKTLFNTLPSNIIYIPYIDLDIFSDLCRISYMVIDFDSYLLDRVYLYTIFLLRKQLIIYDSYLYRDFLVPSKHCYFFKTIDELILRIDKIIDMRVMNLTEVGYDLIKVFKSDEIIKKYRESLQ